jgi:uncharacterized protein (DUF1810 family)
MHGNDPFDLDRFLRAQNPVIADALRELRSGRKQSHWMWFVFPQLRGLGSSAMADRYGLLSKAEAEAFLAHAILGERLIDCTTLVLDSGARSANALFGSPDDVKFRSSMTLFASLDDAPPVFVEALGRYYDGLPDPRTLELLHA